MSRLSETPPGLVSGQEQPKRRCRLLELPQEIQINIYERCLERDFLILRGAHRGEICHDPKLHRNRATSLKLKQYDGLELVCRKIHEDVKNLRTCYFRIDLAGDPDMHWTILETDNKYRWIRNQIVYLDIRGLNGFRDYPSQPLLTKAIAACPRARHIRLEFVNLRELHAKGLPVREIRTRIQNEYKVEDNFALGQAELTEMHTLSSYLSKEFRLEWDLTVEVITEWAILVIGDIISMYHYEFEEDGFFATTEMTAFLTKSYCEDKNWLEGTFKTFEPVWKSFSDVLPQTVSAYGKLDVQV